MATIVHGGGAEEEIFDGYTLLRCLIGAHLCGRNGDGGGDERFGLRNIDMTRVKSFNVTVQRTNGYDYVMVYKNDDPSNTSNRVFFRQFSFNTPMEIDLSGVDSESKKKLGIEVYASGKSALTINSVTKAE